MTLQEIARARAVWAAKVAALFVLAGGAIGGAAVGLAMITAAVATAPEHYLGSPVLAQMLFGVLATSFFGIFFGFPAAALTAIAYISGAKSMRRRWRITAFGVATSAAWGALFAELISSYPAPPENYLGMAAFFAFAGGAATLACFALLTRWDLHSPRA